MKDVIIACDFPDRETTLTFLRRFTGEKPFLKIGMELFYGEGPDIVRQIKGMGHRVFLDLKLHDIPTTVRRAMANLAGLGVDMVNVHAAGTIAMMEAAREGLREGGAPGAKLIAVTQLTSTSPQAMKEELWIDASLVDTVAHYAKNAKAAGLDGVVCSPLEARVVKDACGDAFLTVTPGIRYPSGTTDDQARVTTPAKAREIGTDYIVVGRPITAAEDPVAA
ncbi:orotidine-5'-phosphate decarboxylase, partial [Eubacteriales bacterium OttesenSCG-928-A19]|nr:orotidine-5'-phosphate decarboxylase [Eubacteriales bacterium OttesenSCG-928-A19]